jgi:TolB-like protein
MSRILYFILFCICLFTFTVSGIQQYTVKVPLDYNYLPGEPFWAKYGSIDNRSVDLWINTVQMLPEKNLGTFLTDESYRFILVPKGSITDYLDMAVSDVLTHYGVTIKKNAVFRLVITPVQLEIVSEDNDEDGDKKCIVILRADYFGPDSTQMFSAYVENEGVSEIDDDDDNAYAGLLDRTLHGAIVKIWGSQVLYTNTPLGSGLIRKTDRGTFAFIADTTVKDLSSFPFSGPSCRPSRYSRSIFSYSDANLILAPAESAERTVIAGSRSDDTVVVTSGHRISLGILPFENGTGNEYLTVFVKSAQERFSATLEQSRTIRIMERGKLTDILNEQALGLSGIMNDSTVVKVGNLSGLQVMVAGNITTAGGYYRMNARIINVETSAIVASSSVLVPDALQIDESGTELAAQLLFKFTEEKLEINRNTMAHPSIVPRATAAATAAVEDAWAVEYNPAAIMKVAMRDVAFFTTFADHLTGTISDGSTVSSKQPPYSNMGLNLTYPMNGRVGIGFGMHHYYRYPRLTDKTLSGNIDYREEATAFTLPIAFGISPKLSFGSSIITDITEYSVLQPGQKPVGGSAVTCHLMLGSLFKLSERFKMAATYSTANIYEKTDEKINGVTSQIERPSSHDFRIGTAMYPTRWFFFFGDIHYRKYEHLVQLQPGFYLGAQFTAYGRPKILGFLPQYGMLPFYIGYAHEPYDRIQNTQAKYFSFGSGYYLNNIYVQWAWRTNVEKKHERNIVLGSGNASMKLTNYTLRAPLFLCVGYRF